MSLSDRKFCDNNQLKKHRTLKSNLICVELKARLKVKYVLQKTNKKYITASVFNFYKQNKAGVYIQKKMRKLEGLI